MYKLSHGFVQVNNIRKNKMRKVEIVPDERIALGLTEVHPDHEVDFLCFHCSLYETKLEGLYMA